ncbi:MAG TPA: pilus assembly protein PilM, partial [Hyalangium sp.]|nr:pilus assembly protein PilM [Hyalangium sp.]
MARILGLDLGSYSVKGVLFESNLRGHVTKAYAEVRRAEGDRTETLRAAVQELLTQHPMQADQVIVALPGPTLMTHAFTLPFVDPKRLEAALPFEVESQL